MSRQRQKGTGGENEVVTILNGSRLFCAARQPGSGIYKGHPDDVIETQIFDGTIEVKTRKSVPITVYDWLGFEQRAERGVRERPGRPRALFMKKDYCPFLVVMTAKDFVDLCEKIETSAAQKKSGSAS